MTRAFVLVGLLLAGCADPAPPAVSSRKAIVGGAPDTSAAHAAVVAISDVRRSMLCTGTLITPRVVLTAAHCLFDGRPEDYVVQFGTALQGGITDRRDVQDLLPHPGYDPAGIGFDIGVLRMTSEAPATVIPIAHLPASLAVTAADLGAQVDLVGFGTTETGTFGTKLHVVDTIAVVCDAAAGCLSPLVNTPAWYFCFDFNPGTVCHGDSGGPAFIRRTGTEYVAGVTAFSQQDCRGYGCSAKVDHYQSFIDDFISTPLDALGTPCTSPARCDSGRCADGVCCDAACSNAPCEVCRAQAGATTNGHCTAMGGTCDDHDACTSGDACQGGACHGSPAVSCPPATLCHTASACDPATGTCLPGSPQNDAADCDDGNPCSVFDSCFAGSCVGTVHSCVPADRCHRLRTCTPPLADCVFEDVSCPAPDDCHQGQCDLSTGWCLSPMLPDGTVCSAGHCLAGVCTADPAPETPASSSGCGCMSGPSAAPALLFALLLLGPGFRLRRHA